MVLKIALRIYLIMSSFPLIGPPRNLKKKKKKTSSFRSTSPLTQILSKTQPWLLKDTKVGLYSPWNPPGTAIVQNKKENGISTMTAGTEEFIREPSGQSPMDCGPGHI